MQTASQTGDAAVDIEAEIRTWHAIEADASRLGMEIPDGVTMAEAIAMLGEGLERFPRS